MCGLTGFITTGARNIGAKDRKDYLRQTLIVDSLRGFHGTGVFYEKKDAVGCGWAKAVEHGTDFVNSKNYLEIEKDMGELRFAVGHNRWATMGNTDDVKCTHPFQEGDITLVHNGTLDADGGLITPMQLLGVEVDSHAICHNLAIHDTKQVIEALDGAFCLIWHDKRDDSLNFVRNSERPLVMWIPELEYLDTIYFGSEQKMMEWILSRNHIATTGGKFVNLPTGEIWKFLPDTLTPVVEKVDLSPTYSYWNNRQYYQGGQYGKKQQVGGQVTKIASPSGKTTKSPTQGVSEKLNGFLNSEGFDRTDRLPFLPVGTSGGVVSGTIESLNTACFIIGQKKEVAHQNWDRRWTIRPVGLRYVPSDGKNELVVIARLVSWHYHDSMWQYGKAWEDDVPFGNGMDDDTSLFHVGNGCYVSKETWFDMTKSGCSMCNQLPSTKHADKLLWIDDGSDSFLCEQCKNSNHIT